MFVIVVFFFYCIHAVRMQGIFSPANFAETSCSGAYQWTTWFDAGDPSITLGEFEITTHIQQIFVAFMCPVPIAIEV